MALVCPKPQGPSQVPLILGTNANLFRRLADLCHGPTETLPLQSMRILTQVKSAPVLAPTIDTVGEIKWPGPGPLTIDPKGEQWASCKVEKTSFGSTDILLAEATEMFNLPAGVLVEPVVLPASHLDADSFRVLLHNESKRKMAIPAGTVVAHLYTADTVTVPQQANPCQTILDPNFFDFGTSPIPETWKDRLKHMLAARRNVFSLSEWDMGLAKGVEHHIRLSDTRPFRERSRRIAPADIDDVRRHLQELLAAGIIKESRSPYASPIVIARKKNGNIRMCIDYRTLNSRTIPDQYTMPRIDDALDCMSGSRWFSVLDLRSGYYQIAMAEEDKEKTAFICPLGFYEFQRMPQGITGAPATFQRLMEKAVGDMHLLQVVVYLDDIIVFGRTLEEHEERLMKVLDRLEEVGLKVSIDKCQFCQPQVRYVGHIVSEAGIATDPEKVEAVKHWKQPTDLKSLRAFLGFCGYYRRFIANYSAVVRPLTELTKGYPPANCAKKRAAAKSPEYFKESQPFGDRWTRSCTTAFHNIIHCLTHAPVLAFADPNKPYILHVDASFSGVGAVLYQQHPEGMRPVAFASRKLSSSEQRYAVHQLEFLALKWAVVDKFHDYLYGARFTVRTDNNPLTYVLTTAKLNATGHRWLAALATYDFDIQYRPGKQNTDADLLSRHHPSEAVHEWTSMSQSNVKAICNSANVCHYSRGHDDALEGVPRVCSALHTLPIQFNASPLELVGDRVLIHNLGLPGKHKLQDRWKSTPYVVVGGMPNLPVYHVKPEKGVGAEKTLHRDHLLPIGHLVRIPSSQEHAALPQMPGTRKLRRKRQSAQTKPVGPSADPVLTSSTEETSSDYDDWICLDTPVHLTRQPSQCESAMGESGAEVPKVDVIERGHSSYNEEMENSSEDVQSDLEAVADTDSEGGEGLSCSVPDDEEILKGRYSKRVVKPVVRLGYDALGMPSDKSLTIIHKGMVIQISQPPGECSA